MAWRNTTSRLLLIAVAIFVTATVSATTWSADNIPMVHLQDRNRYVCDPDNIISPTDLDSADVYLRRLDKECGIQTVFIVVNNVKGADCFRMAEDVGNKYGVGDKKTRRGLVIVVAVNDRKYFIAPGKGLEGDLTDVECDDIARECIVRNMKVNDVDRALLSTVRALYGKFKTGKVVVDDDEVDDEDGGTVLFVMLVLLFCFGRPVCLMVLYVLEKLGLRKPRPKNGAIVTTTIGFRHSSLVAAVASAVAVASVAEAALAEAALAVAALAVAGKLGREQHVANIHQFRDFN